MATTARQVRSRVREQMARQMAAREESALAVATAWDKVEKARARTTAAEDAARAAVVDAGSTFSLPDLADLSGVPLADLRRLARGARATADSNPAATTDDVNVNQEQSATDTPAG
ncbi:hypothetical protein [Pseudokineococcus marinus]|uniref:Uncharacterized protein n=1 Tax=Pseudokineococcus marinus TaxID=351215 RepID=A0A849BK95_9ACTN|nr:hypothetical protein [Pseudokineococcus marinus]NNH21713.1 hypothetical protein [Pseudokineococcus marinus]